MDKILCKEMLRLFYFANNLAEASAKTSEIEKVHINTIWNLQVPNCPEFHLEAFTYRFYPI